MGCVMMHPQLLCSIHLTCYCNYGILRVLNRSSYNKRCAESGTCSIRSYPCVHTHKIGVIYVGAGQQTESEILAIKMALPVPYAFDGVGEFVRLEDCKTSGYYTGGLDCETGSDGSMD